MFAFKISYLSFTLDGLEVEKGSVEKTPSIRKKMAVAKWSSLRTKIVNNSLINEKGEIDLEIVVESLRFAAFTSFFILIIIGIIITKVIRC